MNLNQYLPLNTKESIDLLILDIQSGKVNFSFQDQMGIEIMLNIRKIKLQLYFKECFEKIQPIHINGSKPANMKIIKSAHEENMINSGIKLTNYQTKTNLEKHHTSETNQNKKDELLISKAENYLIKVEKRRSSIDNIDYVNQQNRINHKFSNIHGIAGLLKLPVNLLLQILKLKGIEKTENEKLNESEYLLIEDFIIYRLNEMGIIKPKKNNKKQTKNNNLENQSHQNQLPVTIRRKNAKIKSGSSSKEDGVFNEIAKYGIGKIIYIRSK